MVNTTAGYGWERSSVSLYGLTGGGMCTKATAVGTTLSFLIEYRPEEDVKHILACIVEIVGDTVGDITGMGAGSLRFVC